MHVVAVRSSDSQVVLLDKESICLFFLDFEMAILTGKLTYLPNPVL